MSEPRSMTAVGICPACGDAIGLVSHHCDLVSRADHDAVVAERDRYREAIADALQHPGDARAMARRLRTVREDMRLTIPGCTCGGAGRDEAYHDLHYEGCAALDGGDAR